MKRFALIPVILLTALPGWAGPMTLEDVSPHFPTNAEIVWQAPTNHLPQELPTYITVPQMFSTVTISNAMVLAAFPPKHHISAGDFHLQDGPEDRWSRALDITIQWGQIMYRVRTDLREPKGVPGGEEVAKRAWEYAAKLDIDPSELFEKPESRETKNCEYGEATNQVCSRGTFLTRKIHGLEMRDFGLGITFGGQAQLRGFCLLWPDLKVDAVHPLASPEQMTQSIRAHKTVLALTGDGSMDWAKLKALSTARKVTITKITPYYGEGRYGEEATDNGPKREISPLAEMEVMAELEHSNLTVRMLGPILARDARRLLQTKSK